MNITQNMGATELSLFDLCTAYLIVTGQEPSTKQDRGLLIAALVEVSKTHPRLVAASAEVRKYYAPCHLDCHANRVQNYVANDYRWPAGAGPFQQKLQLVKIQQG